MDDHAKISGHRVSENVQCNDSEQTTQNNIEYLFRMMNNILTNKG